MGTIIGTGGAKIKELRSVSSGFKLSDGWDGWLGDENVWGEGMGRWCLASLCVCVCDCVNGST